MKNLTFRSVLVSLLSGNCPRTYMTISYIYNRRRVPSFTRPKDLSEKLIARMLSREMEQYSHLADKYKVRKFVEEKGLGHLLPKLFGVWTDPSEIDFSLLPDKFVLKTNNGCGYNIFCLDKNKLDVTASCSQLRKWLRSDYNYVETHYKLIEPRILCEEFIPGDRALLPVDYKFMCFHGKPHCILVCTNRAENLKLTTMDLEWTRLDYLTSAYTHDTVIEKPRNLESMIAYASRLSEGLDFVRVDLYDVGEKVYFGELTFTPQKGVMSYFSNRAIRIMGELM